MLKNRFDSSNFELGGSLPKEKNKKRFGLMKDKLGEKIMIKFVELRAKIHSYLIDNRAVKIKKEKAQKSVS